MTRELAKHIQVFQIILTCKWLNPQIQRSDYNALSGTLKISLPEMVGKSYYLILYYFMWQSKLNKIMLGLLTT